MANSINKEISSAFFITFSGDCKRALGLYQQCFGGELNFENFAEKLEGIDECPVVNGALVSEKLAIYGSDLVHNEGRKTGNFMAIYIQCADVEERKNYLEKLASEKEILKIDHQQLLIEITDPFAVRWIFAV